MCAPGRHGNVGCHLASRTAKLAAAATGTLPATFLTGKSAQRIAAVPTQLPLHADAQVPPFRLRKKARGTLRHCRTAKERLAEELDWTEAEESQVERLEQGDEAKLVSLRRKVTEERFCVGNVRLSLVCPSYALHATQYEDLIEYSDVVWPAEKALAHILLQKHRHRWESVGLCELGAGLGLAGLAVAVAGAPRVLLTDYDPLGLELAARSAVCNSVDEIVDVATVDWTEPATWPRGDGQHGFVAAADVLYDASLMPPLAALVAHLGGEALFVEPTTSEEYLLQQVAKFREALDPWGLQVEADRLDENHVLGLPAMYALTVGCQDKGE